MLITFVQTAFGYLREFAEITVVGFVIAGIINAVVNKNAITRYLGGNLIGANLLGATIGIITPLCCCSAIPTALTLYRSGSRRGPACAFLIATPWFNWYGLIALVIFLGPRIAIAIAVSAVVIGFATGVLIDLFGPRHAVTSTSVVASMGCGCGDACCENSVAEAGLFDFSNPRGKVREGVRFAFDMLRELAPWVVAGMAIGAAIETWVPEHTITHYLGGASLLSLLAALVLAAVFSADSLGTLPWVQSLLSKGLGAGSAMAFLVAGVGTNLSTLGPVARDMGTRTAILYAGSVVLLTGMIGFGLNIAL